MNRVRLSRFTRLHLWLIRHGIEFEWGAAGSVPKFSRHLAIAINHHYFIVEIGLDLWHGGVCPELKRSHAENAAEHEQLKREAADKCDVVAAVEHWLKHPPQD